VATCRLILLGGFSLETADGAKLALPTRKDKLLLAYLALSAGRPQPRERLAGLLWGDRGEAQARDSLKQALAGIRQAFRQAGLDPVRADRECVTFELEAIDVDALEFARMAAEPGTCGRAAAIYRGDLLDAIYGRASSSTNGCVPSVNTWAASRCACWSSSPSPPPLATRRCDWAATCSPATTCASPSIAR
jgi:hypothetical protein